MQQVEREFRGYGARAPDVRWPDGARVALSIVINFEEGSERSPLYGDRFPEPSGEGAAPAPGLRDLRNESYFEYGLRVGHWRLLDVLDRHGVPCTYFACAEALRRHPEAARSITAAGHEACSHGLRWHPMSGLTVEETRHHIRLAVKITEATTGQRPRGWFSRAPNPYVRDLLMEEGGFLYDCDSFAEDIPYFVARPAGRWLVIPYNYVTNDMKFRRQPGYAHSDAFFDQLRITFDELYSEGDKEPQMMSVGLHLRHSGRASRVAAIDKFIAYAKAHRGVWFARRMEIAQWWLEEYQELRSMIS